MANREKGYGMTAELNEKKAAKFDGNVAQEAIDWLEEIVGEPSGCNPTSESIHENLKDGQFLIKAINIISAQAGTPQVKPNSSKMAFKQMENIGNFLNACEALGMKKTDIFQTVDLYEGGNIPQVLNGIHALGRKAQAYGFPGLGPKEAQENKREFTQEQLDAGKGVIGLQMGSNKGASQAGQNFGKTRAILD